MYYRGAQAAIVVYDIQNQDSFQRAKTWVKELQRQVKFYLFMNNEIPYESSITITHTINLLANLIYIFFVLFFLYNFCT